MEDDMPGSAFVDSQTLALRYGVTVDTVRAWFRRGWIPGYRAGQRPLLFDPLEVDRVLRDRSQKHRPDQSGTREPELRESRRT